MYKEFQRKRHLEKRKVPRPLPKVSFVEPEVTEDYSEKKKLGIFDRIPDVFEVQKHYSEYNVGWVTLQHLCG